MKTQGNRHSEYADPHEQHTPIPRVVAGLVITMAVWAVSYIAIQGVNGEASLGDRRDPAALAAAAVRGGGKVDGSQLYVANCQACHQATGQGLPGVFPPLAGSPWVSGDPAVISQILLHGLIGPVDVLGKTYNGTMPTFGKNLNDDEIAAVATYVRSQWGNSAPGVDADAVARARAATTGRNGPWEGTRDLRMLAAGQKG